MLKKLKKDKTKCCNREYFRLRSDVWTFVNDM